MSGGATDPPGLPALGDAIDAVDWAGLQHAHGPATDVPDMLRRLAGGDGDALAEVAGTLFHQRTVYSATAAAFPLLAAIAAGEALGSEDRATLIHALAAASPDLPGGGEPWHAALDEAFRAAFPRLMALFAGGDARLRAALVLLAASAPSMAAGHAGALREARAGADERLAAMIDLAVARIERADEATLAGLLSAACDVEPEAEEILEDGGEPADDALSVLEVLAQIAITA